MEKQAEFRVFPGPIAHDAKTASDWRALAKLLRFVSAGTVAPKKVMVDLEAPWITAAGSANTTEGRNMEFIMTAHALVLGPVRGKEDECAFLCGIAAARDIPVFCFDVPFDFPKDKRKDFPEWLKRAAPAGHVAYASKEAALLGCLEYLHGQWLRLQPVPATSTSF